MTTKLREAAEECWRVSRTGYAPHAVSQIESIITRCVEAKREACLYVVNAHECPGYWCSCQDQIDIAIRARSTDD